MLFLQFTKALSVKVVDARIRLDREIRQFQLPMT
jgi:hypothetical protein